jgi:hypothetical protein
MISSAPGNDVVGSENVSVRTDNHAGAEALQSLFALSLRELSSEKLAQRVVTKWKRCRTARNRLRSKHCYNARRDFLNNRRERRDKPCCEGLVPALRLKMRGDAHTIVPIKTSTRRGKSLFA